jgi:uncharacterized membrane protein (UPF0127 family)
MQKKYFVFLVIFSLPSLFLYGCKRTWREVCIKDVCVYVELSVSPLERQRGLMHRKALAYNKGMLFIFEEEAEYNFWLKNVEFPLDIIWIDRNKRIVDIKKNIPPCKESCESISPQASALYVLEVNSGFAEKNQISIGDKVEF